MVDERLDENGKRLIVTFEVDPELKRWLELRAAERVIEGRPYRERSVSAVVRDIVDAARGQELALAS